MAIFVKTIDGDDINQLTITDRFNAEPFPSAEGSGAMTVKDEQGSVWTFKYKVKPRNKRVFCGHWVQFFRSNGVRVGDRVAISNNDPWSSEAEYKIEVIKQSTKSK